MHKLGGLKTVYALGAAGLATLATAAPASASLDEVRFGVPPWPGVTVKSEVAAQLMEAMGYQSKRSFHDVLPPC